MRILVVEDDPLIALDLCDFLEGQGHVVIGPATSVGKALDLIQCEKPDAAVLDVNIGGSPVVPIAEALRITGTPFVVVSGHTPEWQPEALQCGRWLLKPHKEAELRHAIANLAMQPKSTPKGKQATVRRSEGDLMPVKHWAL
jgi:DNA-binding response OmpR family regulator